MWYFKKEKLKKNFNVDELGVESIVWGLLNWLFLYDFMFVVVVGCGFFGIVRLFGVRLFVLF